MQVIHTEISYEKAVIESLLLTHKKYGGSNMSKGATNFVTNTSSKSKKTALRLCIFLGLIGAHYYYVGRIGMGLLYTFTFGLFFFGWIIDIFRIQLGSFKDNVDAPLRQ